MNHIKLFEAFDTDLLANYQNVFKIAQDDIDSGENENSELFFADNAPIIEEFEANPSMFRPTLDAYWEAVDEFKKENKIT